MSYCTPVKCLLWCWSQEKVNTLVHGLDIVQGLLSFNLSICIVVQLGIKSTWFEDLGMFLSLLPLPFVYFGLEFKWKLTTYYNHWKFADIIIKSLNNLNSTLRETSCWSKPYFEKCCYFMSEHWISNSVFNLTLKYFQFSVPFCSLSLRLFTATEWFSREAQLEA